MSPELFLAACGGVFGLLVGSFLNVCIVRWPQGQSVVRPRSRCPRCEAPIAWYHNIPVVSWVALRGRCRTCREPISPMYPLVELAVAGLWAWMAWKYGLSLEALRWGAFGTVLVGIAFTDAREFIIPHGFTFGGLALAVVLGFADGAGPGLATLHDAIFGAGLVYLIGAAAELALRKEAMGGGDVAMMAMIGAFLGWQSVVAVLFLGAVVGLVLHGVVLPFRRARGSTPAAPASNPERPASAKTAAELKAEGYLPFGVSLAIAAGLVAFLLGPGAVREWFAAYAAAIGIAP